MTLFFDGMWEDPKYKYAVVDFSTTNTSWIHMAKKYKAAGRKNWKWPLVLLDVDLLGLDPHYEGYSEETYAKMKVECTRNPFYFYREVARAVSSSGSISMPVSADRGLLGSLWLAHQHVDTTNVQLRQTGKTFRAYLYVEWLLTVGTKGATILWMTTTERKRADSIRELRVMLNALPKWCYSKHKGDTEGQQYVTNYREDNKVIFEVGQKDKQAAEQKGRGYSISNMLADEVAEMANSHISLGAAVGSGNKAREIAAKYKQPYVRMFMCTAGNLLRPEGKFYYTLSQTAMPFSEMLFDCADNAALIREIGLNSKYSSSPTVDITLSWRQLGISKERFRAILEDSVKLNPGDMDKVKRECLSIWSMGGTGRPLTPKQAEVVIGSIREPNRTERTAEGIYISWYVTAETVEILNRDHRIALGIDTSNANGKDACSITITDLATLAPLGRADISVINLHTYANAVVNLLLAIDQSILVIENKSSGQAIIDAVWLKLYHMGQDPFKRIYNVIYQEPERFRKDYTEITTTPLYKRNEQWYGKFKGKFGFPTNSSLRQQLFGEALISAVQYAGNRISNRTLAEQLAALEDVKGRIDHPVGGHDDAVISYLLTVWFAMYGRNLLRYDIPVHIPLSMAARTEDGNATAKELTRQKRVAEMEKTREILLEDLRNAANPMLRKQLQDRVNIINNEIEKSGGEIKTAEQYVQQIREQGKKR